MGRLIIDETTIYEIDEECMKRREQTKQREELLQKKEAREKTVKILDNEKKERPAP